MRLDDFIITIAYFSIPLQLVFSLYRYPRLASMPLKILILCILFALFIFLCGFGHLMRCLNKADGNAFLIINAMTSVISFITALYLLPLVPSLMSELDSSLQDLVNLNRETEESKRKLFTFMSFLCHEIRNPLFAITSNVEFATDFHLDLVHPDLAASIDSIHQSATLMLRLVNDVLDLSKIESGKLELEEQEFDLREFFVNLSSSMERQIQHKSKEKVKFVYNPGKDLPSTVRCDSVRLLQIAYNILSNACKFTEEGSITFSVSVFDYAKAREKGLLGGSNKTALADDNNNVDSETEDDDSSDAVGDFSMALLQSTAEEGRCSVVSHNDKEVVAATADADYQYLEMRFEDTGVGIPKERMSTIFEPYAQSKLSDYRKHGGTGLGLSIISKLTELMKGSIRAHSVENEGSTFIVCLPILIPKKQGMPRRNSFARAEDLLENSAETLVPPPPKYQQSKHLALFSTGNSSNNGKRASAPPLLSVDNPLLFDLEAAASQSSPPPSTTITPDKLTASTPLTVSLHNNATSYNSLLPSSSSSSGTNSNQTTTLVPLQDAAPLSGNTTSTKTIASPTTAPTTTVSKPNKTALSKFHFEKNRNVVLVVDDNAVNRKLIGKMLSFFNVEHKAAEHGQAAVDIMMKSKNITGDNAAMQFGLVLMDLSMPVMDGYEAIETLRRLGVDVPIVALTANALQEEKEKALNAGASEFATKPILRPVLHDKCKLYLSDDNNNNTSSSSSSGTTTSKVQDNLSARGGSKLLPIKRPDRIPSSVDGDRELVCRS